MRREPCACKPGMIASIRGHAGMRERHQPARLSHVAMTSSGVRPCSRHERRPAGPEQAVECVIPVLRAGPPTRAHRR